MQTSVSTSEPVERIPADTEPGPPRDGVALCLSGGGFRAMLFHLGSLWRLNELGQLPRLDRISSVSGGSIVAAALGLAWSKVDFDAAGVARAFGPMVVEPVRKMACHTIDVPSVLAGLFSAGTIPGKITAAYRTHLYGASTLQSLPLHPRFIINATGVQSKALWRFSRESISNYRVGKIASPQIELAVAVTASSAFPPFLSPLQLQLDAADYTPGAGLDLDHAPYTTNVFLTDGGVYDNLGLETAWKRCRTVLVSDGGGQIADEACPQRDWARHSYRILTLLDNQVRALRKRQVIGSFQAGSRLGAYWGIRTDISNYGIADSLPFPHADSLPLAGIPTRLAAIDPLVQEQIINWGYAVCDTALRAHVDARFARPAGLPY
jgi:Predicted esterase of the alpha-beta hydrolase superfamily